MNPSPPLRIGVSPQTFEASRHWSIPASATLVPVTPQDPITAEKSGAVALWRRQPDPTAWVTSLLPRLGQVVWLHTDTVGVERLPLELLGERGIALTNARGAFAAPMVEWILCTMLMSCKRMPQFLERAKSGVWAAEVVPSDLRGRKAMVLGYGSVARPLVQALHPLGVKTFCVRRHPSEEGPAEPGDSILSVGDDWRARLPECDFLIVTVPLTAETASLVDADAFSRLRPGARLINVARAQVVDEDAMVRALRAGTLAEAWLDVFATEPLPSESPLWCEPNVFVTPHRSAVGESNEAATREVFLREWARFVQGEPFVNRVDPRRGY